MGRPLSSLARSFTTLAVLVLVGFGAGSWAGQVRTDTRERGFLFIPGIPGDSKLQPEAIEIVHVGWGRTDATRPTLTTTSVRVTKLVDTSSRLIAEAAQERRRFPVVRLLQPVANGQHLEVTMYDVTIGERETPRVPTAEARTESVSLHFAKIKLQ